MMVYKTAYNSMTGQILYTISGPEGFVVFPDIEGVSYVDGVGDSLAQEVINGKIVNKSTEVLHKQEIDSSWVQLKSERAKRLFSSDWTQVPDAPVDREAWAIYRQQLRDLPENTPDPRYPIWPTPPKTE